MKNVIHMIESRHGIFRLNFDGSYQKSFKRGGISGKRGGISGVIRDLEGFVGQWMLPM